ncbi:metallophosphoesterase [Parabacteroides sp. OttesenSCG-928-N08]|nr:metallophosphoesterase [Parabacteroides sp. OttesenSCG-928-N08]
MVFNRYFLFSSVFVLFLTSCEMIDYHPYDGRVDTSGEVNKANIVRIERACRDKDTIRFVMMGDTQRSYDEAYDFVKHINRRNDIDFVIHGGDIADFGMKKEYEWGYEVMSKLTPPFVTIIGNHDIIGNGLYVYLEMFGDDNFSFIAGDTKFVCLNTNAIEYDYSYPVPDFNYIKQEIADSLTHRRTVVAMHAPPGNEQFNNNVKDFFQDYLHQFKSLQFCLHAHNHNVSINDLFNDGLLYYGCANIAKRSYLLFTLYPDRYSYEVVLF